ncbi:glycoside hydrolase domain-containing protein [Kitasatospora sp. LaBMicrA B282]|uniref:glycoside hydrolase domain-containing protein n=1 Tax=Kitasatospora sp. LaBMicrA B282 TaxID=3420949 RepID=UPI003D0CCF12
MRFRELAGAVAAALVFSAAGLAAAGPAGAAADAGRTVSYRGTEFRVPASWPVIDLDRAPDSCVRFDRHAVYLGRPGARQHCPAHLVGRTEALSIQPAEPGAGSAARENPVEHEITVGTAAVTVTATYGADRAVVQAILDSAGLPQPSRAPAPAPTRAAPARASAARDSATRAAAVAASTTDYTGKGFDPCTAPSSADMNTWLGSSPYRAIGLYVGGVNRGCPQPNLTADWVAQQAASGWHFFPLYVGYQAPGACNGSCAAITSADQGAGDADDAIAQLSALGFPAGTPIFADSEPYDPSHSTLVLGYLSAWTTELHARGYLSGVYGGLSSTITDLVANHSAYAMPDAIDFAVWPGSGDTSTSDPAIPDDEWANHQRIHQYEGDTTETYGGVSLAIDADYLDLQLAPPGGGWDDFGDGRQNPAIGRQADGAMIAFAVSPDQQGLYYRTQSAPNGGWGGWQQLGGPVGGLPVVGRDPDGRLELFVLGPGRNSIQHIWQTAPDGGWSSWDPTFGGPAAGLTLGQNADGRLEVFALAVDDSSISHVWQTAPNGGWSAWNGDGNGVFGGPAGGVPVVGHEADGRMAVFVLGPNGSSIAEREQVAPSAGWGDWNGSFGTAAAGLTVGQNADGRMEVFALAPDRSSISHVWQTAPNGGWSAWNGDGNGVFGGPAGGVPVVGHEADGRMAVFVLGPNGSSIAEREQVAPSAGWGDWNGSFGTAAATVNVSHNADGRLEVFALAPGGADISHVWQTAPNGGWSAWNGDGTFGGPAWVGP